MFSVSDFYGSSVSDDTQKETLENGDTMNTDDNSPLPAYFWVGMFALLIVMRVLYEYME